MGITSLKSGKTIVGKALDKIPLIGDITKIVRTNAARKSEDLHERLELKSKAQTALDKLKETVAGKYGTTETPKTKTTTDIPKSSVTIADVGTITGFGAAGTLFKKAAEAMSPAEISKAVETAKQLTMNATKKQAADVVSKIALETVIDNTPKTSIGGAETTIDTSPVYSSDFASDEITKNGSLTKISYLPIAIVISVAIGLFFLFKLIFRKRKR